MKKLSLFMLMAVGLLISGNVWSATLTVGTSGADYTTIAAALEHASDGDEIQLLTDINEAVTINKAITLDLNGKKLYSYDYTAVLTLNATEILVKNGTVETYSQNLQNNDEVKATGIVIGGGHAKLLDVTVTAKEDKPYYGVDVRENASLDIKGSGEYKGVYVLGLGRLNDGNQQAYRVNNVHIEGTATFYTKNSCFANTADGAYVVISGNTSWVSESNNYILNNAGQMLIEGGTFTAANCSSTIGTYGKLWVTGGTFIAKESSNKAIDAIATEYIYGGRFSGTHNRQGSLKPSDGYVYVSSITESGRTLYEVKPYVAQIVGGDFYASVQSAVNAAVDYKRILMVKHDVTGYPYWENGYKTKTMNYGVSIAETVTISGKKLTIENQTEFGGKISATDGAIVSITGTDESLYGESTTFAQSGEGSKINIVGGIFSKQQDNQFLGQNVSFTARGTSPETYKAAPDKVAKIGDTYYSTLQEAIAAAQTNQTVILVADATGHSTDPQGIYIGGNKTLTIDLNGFTISQISDHRSDRGIFNIEGGNFTIKNGTMVALDNETDAPCIMYNNKFNGTLSLENLTINHPNCPAIKIMLEGSYQSTLNIDANCHLNGKGSIGTCCWNPESSLFIINNKAQLGEVNIVGVSHGGSINAYNGSITNSGTLTLVADYNNVVHDKDLTITNKTNGTIYFDRGTFKSNLSITENSGTIIVNGGAFSDDFKQKLVAAGAQPTEGKDWNRTMIGSEEGWTVLSDAEMQCYIGDNSEYKSTFLTAISNVLSGEKITLIKDVDLENIMIDIQNKNITIELNGHKIEGQSSVQGKDYLFKVNNGSITLDDSSPEHTGSIVFEDKYSAVPETATFYLMNESSLTINGGTIENKTDWSVDEAICINYSKPKFVMNGGKVKGAYGVRIRPNGGGKTETDMLCVEVNGGEIEALYYPLWIFLDSNSSIFMPYIYVKMTGGKLVSKYEYEGRIYVYSAIHSVSYGAKSTFEHVKIDVTGGTIEGYVKLSGGSDEKPAVETVDLSGGIYSIHNALRPQKRSAETKIQYISGGAYFFDYATNSTDTHLFAEFCEYIKPGHYATKMTLVQEEVTDKENQPYYLYGGQKYTSYNDLPNDITDITSLHYVYANHEFAFMTKEQEVSAKTYWAVIDAKGPSKVNIITSGTKEEPVVLDPDDYKPIDEILINGGVVEVQSDDTLEVNRIQVGKDGNGAGVIVRTDATLIVGLNGLQVDEASTTDDKVTYVIVEAGGTLETNGTIISNDVKEIIIESDETHGLGSVLISPDVTYNNEPRATVYMATTAHHKQSNNTYYWQHFGIPCIGAQEGKDKPDINNPVAPWWTWDADVLSYFNQWINNKWEGFTDPQILKVPFRGYNVTNESTTGDVNYIFKGFLIGNDNAVVKFTHLGYNVMGNSYTAPIDVLTMLDNLKSTYGDNIQGTVWIYQSATDNHISATLKELQEGEAEFKTIGAMQGFILKLDNGSVDQIGNINYRDAVWMNPNKAGIPLRAPKMSNEAKANIIISSASSYDKVKLYENSDYTSAFENGADAPKLMNNALNIYANTEVGQLTSMVSNNLEGTDISITTGKETTYTLSFEKVNNMNYILRDMITNTDIVIVEGNTYEFTAPANATLENRFKLINPAYVPTDIDEQKTSVKPQGIYTTLGQYLGTEETWTNLSQGVYVINGVKVIK